MKQLTIGLVLDDSLDKSDGVQQYVLAIGAWMTSQGHNVHYLMGETQRTDIQNVHSLSRNINVRFNGNRMSIPLPGSSKKVTKLLATIHFDVLHVQVPYSPLMAGKVINKASPKSAVIGTFHIAPYSTLVSVANRVLSVILRKSLKRFDDIVSVSQAAADFAYQTYRIKSEISPNVVDVARFKNAHPLIKEKVPIIIFVGRLVERKGCGTLLEAVDKLVTAGVVPKFKVYIGGLGHLMAELRQYVVDHDLQDIVTFSGYINEKDKAGYYASADIAVFPSSGGESFGIVLLEAMASGRSVVLGGDNPGYRTVLGPRPELLFPARNSDALAEKLTELLTNAQSATDIKQWQNEYVPSFDVAVIGDQLIKRYSAALKTH